MSVEIDGVRETRPYSPAGSEHAAGGALELTVSTHPEGRVSRYLRDRARPGMIVGLTQAEGDFVLPDPRPERVLLISGGSGITPVMAMLRTLCDEGFAGEIGFLNYARSAELALYGAELDQLAERHAGLRVARGFTRGGGLPLTGRFCREHLRAVTSEHATAATFVCGPPALIDSVRAVWAQDGLAEPLCRELHAARAAASTPTAPRASSASPPADARPPTAACRCSSRPRTPGSPPSTAAAWASATPAAAARRPARCATSSPASSRAPGRSRSASACPCRSATSRSTSEPPLRSLPVPTLKTPLSTPLQNPSRPHRPPSTRPPCPAPHPPSPPSSSTPSARSSTPSARASSPTSASATPTTSTRVIRAQRGLEVAGRGLLFAGLLPPAWLAGTAALSLSKILDNMEIGHNVMHGQYDWMRDPRLNGKTFEWDTACPADQWRHSHNYMHHTYTNIVGKDRDIGYGILRMSEDERVAPVLPRQPALRGAAGDLLPVRRRAARPRNRADRRGRDRTWRRSAACCEDIWRKVRGQTLKDYVLFPLLSGPSLPFVLAGNATANLVRNLWAFTIIFCGHFPEGTHEFTEEETAEETRGEWYFRQLLGSANLTGGKLFHILAGNLSFQIEHHLFPDIPAHRYAEISVEVREICGRYGIPYNTGPLHKQFGSVVRKIVKLALPPRRWLSKRLDSVVPTIVKSALAPLPGRGGSDPDGGQAAAQAQPHELAAVA